MPWVPRYSTCHDGCPHSQQWRPFSRTSAVSHSCNLILCGLGRTGTLGRMLRDASSVQNMHSVQCTFISRHLGEASRDLVDTLKSRLQPLSVPPSKICLHPTHFRSAAVRLLTADYKTFASDQYTPAMLRHICSARSGCMPLSVAGGAIGGCCGVAGGGRAGQQRLQLRRGTPRSLLGGVLPDLAAHRHQRAAQRVHRPAYPV